MFPNAVGFIRNCQHVEFDHFQIPFVLYFNTNKEIVRPPLDKNTQELTKYAFLSVHLSTCSTCFHFFFIFHRFAIIPLENRSYTFDTKTPRGEEQLQERHLGMLGYNVIKIFFDDWNKMHMSLPGEKLTFLRKILSLV